MQDPRTEGYQGAVPAGQLVESLKAQFLQRIGAGGGARPDRRPADGHHAPSLVDVAIGYCRRGWSIIPIGLGTKKPTCKWTKYQTEPATESQLTKWFANGQDVGLAVICGPISGGLVCRDFDTMEGYNRWAADHPDLANTLPTVATARGRHVYFRSNHSGIKTLDDGELRGGGYCLLPPSRHPDGPKYRWLIPLPDGSLPVVEDVRAAGFLGACNVIERTECTETTESTEDYRGN